MRMSEDIREEIAAVTLQLEEQLRFYREIGVADIGGAGNTTKPAAGAVSRAEVVSDAGSISEDNLLMSTEPALDDLDMPKKKPSPDQAGLFGDILIEDAPAARSEGATLPVIQAQDVSLEAIREDIGECTRCKLHEHRTKIVFGEGNPNAKLVFIGEGPGADEDATGRPFVGRAGQLLDKIIQAIGLKREDVYISNVVKCRPPGNRTPERDEVATCEQFLFRQLALIRPRVIVALGSPAFQCLLRTKETITRARGQWRDWNGIKVMPTFHPAYLLRSPDKKREAWDDMKKIRDYLNSLPD